VTTDVHDNASFRIVNTATLLGALLPDFSLFFMFGQAKLRGISDDVIWGEMYFSSFWQEIGAITNSLPVYAFIAAVGLLLGGRIASTGIERSSAPMLGNAMLALGLAALLHCLTDLPLHVDDGHAHFWPFSHWIYSSPVSYWDSNHYAHYWQPIELLLALLCILTIWRRFTSIWVRIATIVGLMSYGVIILMWTFVSMQ